ncbi:MAG: homocysteine S-methyltransferase family protein, partial [Myxococcales bacterium]|nr:homocysteine S-methyltransferase family protein [Myxococcales bacterium]
MSRRPFMDALAAGGLVFDGAMGTALYERGFLYNSCLDGASLSHPDVVRRVHEDYAAAGANVLQTNTFGANAYRLGVHGLREKVRDINRRGVELARAAAGETAYVVGSIGPTGLVMKTVEAHEHERIRAAFAEQASALSEAGVDALILETFRQPEELHLAIEGVREGSKGAVPLIASCSFDAFGTMADGTGPEAMEELLL